MKSNPSYKAAVEALENEEWTAARVHLDGLNSQMPSSHPKIPEATSFGVPEWYAPVLQGRIDQANIRRVRF